MGPSNCPRLRLQGSSPLLVNSAQLFLSYLDNLIYKAHHDTNVNCHLYSANLLLGTEDLQHVPLARKQLGYAAPAMPARTRVLHRLI